VTVFNEPISINTITGRNLGGVKAVWTVDAEQAFRFRQSYFLHFDIVLVKVNLGELGLVYLLPKSVQKEIISCKNSNKTTSQKDRI
jgi:hypothetical protein